MNHYTESVTCAFNEWNYLILDKTKPEEARAFCLFKSQSIDGCLIWMCQTKQASFMCSVSHNFISLSAFITSSCSSEPLTHPFICLLISESLFCYSTFAEWKLKSEVRLILRKWFVWFCWDSTISVDKVCVHHVWDDASSFSKDHLIISFKVVTLRCAN